MVMMNPDFPLKYEEYQTRVASPFFRRKGNEKRLWLGLRRECRFGDAGNMEPCSSKQCLLCSLVKSSVSKELSEQGIMTTSSLARAVEMSTHRKSTSKVVLMANVLLGREVEVKKHEFGQLQTLQGFDSVRLVEYTLWGRKIDNGESLVFSGDAVRPLYLITHE